MLIYGKIFGTMFEGSMRKAGSDVFAVMAYVISHMQPDKTREEFVHLNPDALADAIGETPERMQKAIDYLCAPDPKTTTPNEDGRRLIKQAPYLYWVVNGKHYRLIMNEEERRVRNATRQADWRRDHPKDPKKQRTKAQIAAAYEGGRNAFVSRVENGMTDEDAMAAVDRDSALAESPDRNGSGVGEP